MKTKVASVITIFAALLVWQASAADSPSPVFTNSLGMPFVKVPGTRVQFCIWDTRVQDYEKFVKAAGAVWLGPESGQGPTHPAVNVCWNDAKKFCQWLTDQERKAGRIGPQQSYRLPTDAEWSVAVGLTEPAGGTPEDKDGAITNVYPWGAQWPPPNGAGNYAGSLKTDRFRETSPVGSFKANQFGLHDMGGNVSQWCEDWYEAGQRNRVIRGSDWVRDSRSSLGSSRRGWLKPGDQALAVGFRCVLAETPAP